MGVSQPFSRTPLLGEIPPASKTDRISKIIITLFVVGLLSAIAYGIYYAAFVASVDSQNYVMVQSWCSLTPDLKKAAAAGSEDGVISQYEFRTLSKEHEELLRKTAIKSFEQ